MYATAQGFAKMTKPTNQVETKPHVEKENDTDTDAESLQKRYSDPIGPQKLKEQC